MAANTETKKRAYKKWESKEVDDLRIRVPKGCREIIRDHATARGETINSFVFRSITETMERDNKQ